MCNLKIKVNNKHFLLFLCPYDEKILHNHNCLYKRKLKYFSFYCISQVSKVLLNGYNIPISFVWYLQKKESSSVASNS